MSGFVDKPFEAFRVGDRATFAKTIGEADLLLFGAVSGDLYPLHFDEEYAKTTRFGRRAAHGMLSSSLISTVCGLLLQKPGGLLLGQNVRYRKPVFIGDTLTATAEVAEIDARRRRLRCRAEVRNQRGEIVVDGETLLQKDPA